MRRVRRTVFLAGLVTAGLVVGGSGSLVLAATAAPAAAASSPTGSWGTAINVPGTSAEYGAQVGGVSCAPGGQCMAAGNGLGKNGTAFAITEKNGAWGKAAAIPGASKLSEFPGLVTSVSCPATGDCLVVGTTLEGEWYSQEIRGHWGTAKAIPGLSLNPSEDLVLSLLASCTSAGDCAVAGEYLAPSGSTLASTVFVATEKGYNNWVPAAPLAGVPTVANGIPAVTALSCASTGNCVLGGGVLSIGGISGDGLGGLGGLAREQALRDVRSARSLLARASVHPATAFDSPTVTAVPFVASEVSGDWQGAVQPTLAGLPSTDAALVSSAACPPGGECVVAGVYGTSDAASAPGGSFLLSPSGTTWTTPVTNSTLGILGLACPSTGECTAVGSTAHGIAAVARQSGGEWTTRQLPGVTSLSYKGKKASSSEVDSLACASVANCSIVGDYTTGNASSPTSTEAFVGGEVNGKWSSAMVPASLTRLNSGGNDGFTGVACASAATCAAGGSYTVKQGDGAFTLAELPARVTATTLARSHSVVTFGHEQAEKLSVSVTSKSGTPGGKVIVKAATKTVCTITLKSGKGSCTLSAKEFNAGKYHLIANYVPVWPYARSASSSGPLTVRS
jgi:Bacterial Ig-like domain (group 3)